MVSIFFHVSSRQESSIPVAPVLQRSLLGGVCYRGNKTDNLQKDLGSHYEVCQMIQYENFVFFLDCYEG